MEELVVLKSRDASVASPAWESLYRELHDALFIAAQSIVGCPHQAEDLVQDVFANCLGKIDDCNDNVRGWLLRCVQNAAKSAKRRRSETKVGKAVQLPADVADGQLSPGTAMVVAEKIVRLKAAINTLPEEQRQVVKLFYIDKWTCDAIARHFGRASGTIRVLLYRTRLKLKELLGGSSSGR